MDHQGRGNTELKIDRMVTGMGGLNRSRRKMECRWEYGKGELKLGPFERV